ncbi:hypothetical protein VE03_00849 [Pseudogymnoascus sp. 23342-1-I1]|nr:hypothetical protein VE03_00849 [Pseudogymnoascus sp. 23342-1-I1]
MGQQPGNSSQSGDHQQPINDAAATATAHGDILNSLRGDDVNPSPPPHSELVSEQQPGAGLSAEQQILPVTAASVSETIDVVDAPNVASPTTESRPLESHETLLQGGDPTTEDLANPALIIRTSAPANAPSPSPSSPNFTFPTRSNTEFIASFPQSTTTTTGAGTSSANMLFTASAGGAAHRRRSMATTSALTEYEADLTSKDRLKQKEAVRNILASKVLNDFSFPNTVSATALEPSDALPPSDSAHEDPTTWIERADWLSELSSSDDESDTLAQTSTNSTTSGGAEKTKKPAPKKKKINPFRFDSPDGVGEALRRSAERRKLRRQRRLQEELAYNEGLRCFTARRNAWTNARIVRRPRLPPASAGEKPPADGEWEEEEAILDTLLPIAPPLLPPSTPMRRNITSRAHSTIYDKVVMQSQTPMCPINLQTVVSSCVEGWKRDGEWPPRGTEAEAALGRRRGGGEGGRGGQGGERGVWRRSLQRVFGRGGGEIV